MKRQAIIFGCMILAAFNVFAQKADTLQLAMQSGEYWWTGLSAIGQKMPFDVNSQTTRDLWGNNMNNQAQPLLLSSKGRYVWSEVPIKYSFDQGKITVTTRDGEIKSGTSGKNLKDAYNYCVQHFFPPDGEIPDKILFTKPQFNTWIELQYDQNETDILKYARNIIDHGYDPGILMLDDTWQEDYGVWDFAPRKFKDPKKMMDKLHAMGFKVMLWVCPFVSPDSKEFRYLAQDGLLLLDSKKAKNSQWKNTRDEAAIIRWWNGASACLDLSNPKARAWFKQKLDRLQKEYGVDGFKFDAGDADFYTGNIKSFQSGTPNDQTTFFAKMGLDFPLNEYRASWKLAGLPLGQRLSDKRHSWSDLQKLIPDMTANGLMGYAYTCPDMIGGGQVNSFKKSYTIDQELIVRSAQVHALMPMMQFSVAPWRILSKRNEKICLQAAKLHVKMGDKILNLAKNASQTGEPIVRSMALAFPNNGYESIKDQFMLGSNILVAPVVKKGVYKRKVVLPKGKWKGDDGKVVRGNRTIEVDVPLKRIPHFKRID